MASDPVYVGDTPRPLILYTKSVRLLNDAVFRGLYAFELVDSGIDWIGMIPSHWRLEPFSTLDNDPKYLECLLRSDRFVEKFGRRSFDDESLSEIVIPRPPLFEQAEIADYLEAQRSDPKRAPG